MGNICASTRNKECLYAAKEPMVVKNAFSDCVCYTKCDSKQKLKKSIHINLEYIKIL